MEAADLLTQGSEDVAEPSEIYFAAKPIDELASTLESKVSDYYTFIQTSGIFQRIRKSYQAYYGLSDRGFYSSGLSTAGDQDELTTIKVNHYRSIILALLNMTTAQKAAFEVRAANTDSKSQAQAILADGILDYYLREKRLDRVLRSAVEICLVMGEGYVSATWEPTSGEQYGVNPETGAVVYEGDLNYDTVTPLDLIKEVNAQSASQTDWVIRRTWKNRFDLAAKHKDKAEDILAMSADTSAEFSRLAMTMTISQKDNDLIPVFEFYHRKSESVENGRHVIFLDADTVLFDGPLPYRRLPVHRICAAELHGTPFGYSPTYDLLGLQEILDMLFSTIVTNQATFGVQNIWTKPGSGLTLNQLRGGMNHFESNEPPEPLQLAKTAPETFTFIQTVIQNMETLSGVNSTVRGNPSEELHSGAALAMVASQAVQFNSGLQQAWASLFEDVGTSSFEILQDFAQVPRIAAIAGDHNRSYMKKFSGQDIEHVSRVVVDLGNPMSRTTAGRIEMANQLLQAQKFDAPEEYIQVISTGKLEPLIQNKQSQLINIATENEALRAGKAPMALITDDHRLHCVEHMSVIDDFDARQDPQITSVTLAHVQEHLAQWRSADPAILQLRGLQPLAPPPPPPGMLPPPGMPGPGAALPDAGPAPGQAVAPPGPPPPHGQPNMSPHNPPVAEANGQKGPRMPSLPKGAPQGVQDAYSQVKAQGTK